MAIIVAVACRWTSAGYAYPGRLTDYFGEGSLIKASGWVNGGTSAAVYVPEGETMPDADLQVGIIVSYDKPIAEELQFWVDEQASTAEVRQYHDPTPSAACTVARNRDGSRLYIALLSCMTGENRAVCVQMDYRFPADEWESCVNANACFQRSCEAKWRDWSVVISRLVTDVLAKR